MCYIFFPCVDIVGIPIKFALNKIGFLREDRKRAIHILPILDAVFWKLQQCLAILVAPHFNTGRENPGIDKICEDCVQIVFKFVPAFDCPDMFPE